MQPTNFGEDLIRVHKVMTRGLRISTEQSDFFSCGSSDDPELVEGFNRYVRALVALMHIHHYGEDKLVWPFLRPRIPDAPYEELRAQHAMIADKLAAIKTAQQRGAMSALHEQLEETQRLWHDHIQIEETSFSVSVTEDALAPEEHLRLMRRLARHAQLHSRPIPLVVAFTLYNLPPEDRAAMEHAIPGVVTKFLLPVVWKRAWAPMKPFLLPV